MLFSSLEFILVFLPLTGLLFWAFRRFAGVAPALGVLTAASLAFYAISSVALQMPGAFLAADEMSRNTHHPLLVRTLILGTAVFKSHLSLLLLSVAFNYLLAIYIEPGKSFSKIAMAVGVGGNVALLFWFKYAFFTSQIGVDIGLFGHPLTRKLLPLGISFFTFVQIAYLVDRYKGKAPVASFWRYLLFVSFFPHLIAGPIVHHATMMPQLERPHSTWQSFTLALFIFAVGLSKKTLLADPLGSLADAGFKPDVAQSLATVNAWMVVLSYTLQLYFDFSGYSDMAIGLALMFGVRFPWNFLSPYKSTSVGQFWRNWHITLSNFLKDYVYIPLGGSRQGPSRTSVNLLLTMIIGGIWHGAGWTFILWGALHGTALVINHLWSALQIAIPKLAGWIATMIVVISGWVLFRAPTLHDAVAMYRGMFGHRVGWIGADPKMLAAVPYLLIAITIVLALPNTRQLSERFRPRFAWAIATAALMFVCMVFVLGRVSAPEFLYYDF